MHYPWWYVPHLTAPMLIAVIATVHVLVSHYAVGGGLFLAVELGYAYRVKDRDYLAYLKRHAGFFILLTVVFGAITGVGIWWTIALASPLATELLIRTFVFGWATEWVFFVLELASAFIVYYCWGKLAEKTHVTMAWIYALAAWISLVLITGITAFMSNPGDWLDKRDFWTAFFNPQFIPQTIARTGGALLLTSLYVYFHASLAIKDCRLRDMIGSRSARPALAGAIMVTVGGLGWYLFLPESAKAILLGVASLNILIALIFALTIITFFLLYFGPYRNPGWPSPGFAGALFLFGLAAFSTGEFIREAVRKPYVIYNVVLGNQIQPDEVPKLRNQGYLEGGVWTKAFVAKNYPQTISQGSIEENRLLELHAADRIGLGKTLFQYHCNDCHAGAVGYSAVGPLLRGRSREQVRSLIELLDSYVFMPPWAGTSDEAELLTDYLMSIAPHRPEGMRLGSQPPEVR
ncbi:MAG: cytochrome ubiquinol oxidase subunit I [Thermoguttaceae bacterium]